MLIALVMVTVLTFVIYNLVSDREDLLQINQILVSIFDYGNVAYQPSENQAILTTLPLIISNYVLLCLNAMTALFIGVCAYAGYRVWENRSGDIIVGLLAGICAYVFVKAMYVGTIAVFDAI